ncbi:acyltransferase family protein [Flavisolibacter ginsenosidimutans]|uniref:Acyltransferase n=1 Tax=Flavisolibacter ginsenosidimutans TaxID=661481 RepID=A0A5B8UEN2_9BACT|nr:acyltransferase [Flavisolibacter ginsenosidimutans]QEC54882.1 acyltransferase [Flavisolibacter ginsenosidimutans]
MLTQKTAITIKAPLHAKADASKDTAFYPQLNGLRFVFIFMVLLHHWMSVGYMFLQYRIGWVGVDLFFVLSGFLIGEILLRESDVSKNRLYSIRNFVIRRALRIFPLYYAVILLYSFFVNSGGIILYNLTYTNNILQAFNLSLVDKEFWHLWSLCVEEQFYLLFPFLIFFVRKRFLPAVLIGGILFSVVARFTLTAFVSMPDPHVLMPLSLDSLFLGVMLAYLKNYHPELLNKILGSQTRALGVVALSVVALCLLCFFNNKIMVYGFLRLVGSIGGFFLIGYSAIKQYKGPLKIFLENSWVSMLGKISYGLYLVHPFVEKIWAQTEEKNPVRNFVLNLHIPIISNRYVVDFFFLFTITVAISYLSFHFFEKRFLKLKSLFT